MVAALLRQLGGGRITHPRCSHFQLTYPLRYVVGSLFCSDPTDPKLGSGQRTGDGIGIYLSSDVGIATSGVDERSVPAA